MKIIKLFAGIFCAAWLLGACQTKGYELKVSIPGTPDGLVVKLTDAWSGDDTAIDSAIVENGGFVIRNTRPLEFPRYVQLLIDLAPGVPMEEKKIADMKAYSFFLDNGRQTFSCPLDDMPGRWTEREKARHVVITGSPAQQLYESYRASVQPLSAQSDSLWRQYLEVYHRPALRGVFNTAQGMQVVRKRNAIRQAINDTGMNFIRNNPKSVVAVYVAASMLVRNSSAFTERQIDRLVNAFDLSLSGSAMMKVFLDEVESYRRTAKGVKFTDVPLYDPQGRKVCLSEYLKPGRYNMVEFWASWCSPCRGEIPHLRHLHESLDPQLFNIVGISIDENADEWKKAIGEEKMGWAQLNDPRAWRGEACKAYGIHGVPFSLVFDPDGNIVCGSLRGAELDVVLQDVFGDKMKL